MTVAAPSASPASRPAPPAAALRPVRAGRRRRDTTLSTPARFQRAMAVLVILSLAWGGFGAWAVAEHASAASSLAHADERNSQEAQQLYLTIADADVRITTSFLNQAKLASSGQPYRSLGDRQHYDGDIAQASQYLADLKDSAASPQFTASFAAVAGGLATYQGDVQTAITEYGAGTTPAGDSNMQVASEEVHLVLLPAAERIYQFESAAVMSSSDQATSLPTLIVAILVAIATLVALTRVQRDLARRTRRVFNLGLVVATVALVISGGWLAASFAVARSDLDTAIGQGAGPAQALAQASIDVQQIRGDSILNVIARSGTPALQTDANSLKKRVGPGTGTLLDTASTAGNAQASPSVQAAIAALPAWYAANDQGYSYGGNLLYSTEESYVLSSAVSGYTSVRDDLDHAISATQQTFNTQANAGAGAYGPVEAVVIVASLLMAIACAFGLYRRLAEYR